MLGIPLLVLIGGLPLTYSNIPNDGKAQCSQIDEEVGRHLEKARDRHEKRRIYFDLMQWPCEDDALFNAGWFSRALETLGEPSFAQKANAKGYKDRLRLLAFSHTGPGYILRLDYRPDGSALMTFAESEWVERNADRPERRLKRKWSKLTASGEAQRFLDEVEGSRLLQRRFEQAAAISTKNEDGSETICIGWAMAVFERLDRDGQHTVAQTGCGRSEAIYPLIESFHALVGLEPLSLEPMDQTSKD